MKKLIWAYAIMMAILMSPVIVIGFVLGIFKAYLVSGITFSEMFEEFVGDKLGED